MVVIRNKRDALLGVRPRSAVLVWPFHSVFLPTAKTRILSTASALLSQHRRGVLPLQPLQMFRCPAPIRCETFANTRVSNPFVLTHTPAPRLPSARRVACRRDSPQQKERSRRETAGSLLPLTLHLRDLKCSSRKVVSSPRGSTLGRAPITRAIFIPGSLKIGDRRTL